VYFPKFQKATWHTWKSLMAHSLRTTGLEDFNMRDFPNQIVIMFNWNFYISKVWTSYQ